MFASVGRADLQSHFIHTHTQKRVLLSCLILLNTPYVKKRKHVIRLLFIQRFCWPHTHIRKFFDHPLPKTVPTTSSQQLHHTAYTTDPPTVFGHNPPVLPLQPGVVPCKDSAKPNIYSRMQAGGRKWGKLYQRATTLPRQNAPTRVPNMHLSPSKSFLPMLKLPDKLLYLCLLTKHSTCTTPDKKNVLPLPSSTLQILCTPRWFEGVFHI